MCLATRSEGAPTSRSSSTLFRRDLDIMTRAGGYSVPREVSKDFWELGAALNDFFEVLWERLHGAGATQTIIIC